MKRLIMVGAIITALSITGCGWFNSETERTKPQMPKVEQGTVDHFSDKTPEKKQQEPQPKEQKTPTSNTQRTKPQMPKIEEGTVDHFSR